MRAGRAVTGLGVGMLFGIGLSVSQMVNPEKVLAFLTLTSSWDPSLLFVMGAASLVTFIGYRWATGRPPVYDVKHYLPTNRELDGPLIIGACIFGVGWGLAGYCPGPAITALSSGTLEPVAFLAAMLAGSQVARLYDLKFRTKN